MTPENTKSDIKGNTNKIGAPVSVVKSLFWEALKLSAENEFEDLSAIPGLISPARRDKQLIGNLLYELHQTEAMLDDAIALCLMPMAEKERRDLISGSLVGLTSLVNKAKFALQVRLLDKEHADILKYLNERRNSLAHKRPEEGRPYKTFSGKEEKRFRDKARAVRECINKNYNNVWIESLKSAVNDYCRLEKIAEEFMKKKRIGEKRES